MPKQDPFDEYFNDPEFRRLSGPDKISVLSRVDPEFAQLPIREQATVVQNYLSAPPVQGKGVLETAADILGGMVTPSSWVETIRSDPNRQVQEKAAQAFRSGHPIEGLGYTLAGEIPFIGPAAAQSGEDIGEGRTAQGLTEAGFMLAPSAIHATMPVTKAGGGFVKGALKATPEAVKKSAKEYGPYIAPLEFAAQMVPGETPLMRGGAAALGFAPAIPDIIRGGLQGMRESWNRYPYPAGPDVPSGGLPTPPLPTPLRGPLWGGPSPAPTEPTGPINPIEPITPTRGKQMELNLTPASRTPLWHDIPSQESTGLPDVNPITPTTTRRVPPSSVQPPASELPQVPDAELQREAWHPKRDWTVDIQRGVADLLQKHDIDPNDFTTSQHWYAAAQQYDPYLGVPNDNAMQGVREAFGRRNK